MVKLAENVYDMSLSDIIKSNKKKRKTTAQRDLNEASKAKRTRRRATGVVKKTNQVARLQNKRVTKNINSKAKLRVPVVSTKGQLKGRARRPQRGSSRPTNLPKQQHNSKKILSGKLTVGNLHWEVTDHDIKELFSTIGRLKTSGVHYSREGKSLGVAHVEFLKRSDAEKAVNTYNKVPLDGRPMHLDLVDKSEPKVPLSSRLGPINKKSNVQKNTKPQIKNQNRANNRRSKTSGKKNIQSSNGKSSKAKPTPTVEELDKQLDSYIASKQ